MFSIFQKRKKNVEEMIVGLRTMVAAILHSYVQNKNNVDHIVYYRDGVSESQFEEVSRRSVLSALGLKRSRMGGWGGWGVGGRGGGDSERFRVIGSKLHVGHVEITITELTISDEPHRLVGGGGGIIHIDCEPAHHFQNGGRVQDQFV